MILGNSSKTSTMGIESSNLSKNTDQENENKNKDPSSQSTISRVKQAKHAAISKAITEKLTKEEIEEEKRCVYYFIYNNFTFRDKIYLFTTYLIVKLYTKYFRIQREQLAKIYSLLADNENDMGKMTYEDLQNQMSMYAV